MSGIHAGYKRRLLYERLESGYFTGFQGLIYDINPILEFSPPITCGDDSVDTKRILVEILRFKHFTRHILIYNEN